MGYLEIMIAKKYILLGAIFVLLLKLLVTILDAYHLLGSWEAYFKIIPTLLLFFLLIYKKVVELSPSQKSIFLYNATIAWGLFGLICLILFLLGNAKQIYVGIEIAGFIFVGLLFYIELRVRKNNK